MAATEPRTELDGSALQQEMLAATGTPAERGGRAKCNLRPLALETLVVEAGSTDAMTELRVAQGSARVNA